MPLIRSITCKYCSNTFNSRRDAKYCSTSCANRDRLLGKGDIQPKPCIVCGSVYKPQKRTTQFCSNTCSSKYKANNPVFLQKLREGCVKRSQNPDYLEKLSQQASQRWQNPEFREKMEIIYTSDEFAEKSSESYYTKDYVFPSGKTVRVQGYEPRALDAILKTYSEEDILVGKEIRKVVGQILYFDENGHKRRYHPDIFIVSEKKIVEVKSSWTYSANLINNQKKKKACEDLGLAFEFMIL